jgi:hypothetical protein
LLSLCQGLQFLMEGLLDQVFTLKRIKHRVTSVKNSIPDSLRQGGQMANIVHMAMLFRNDRWMP